jgi:transcriptional regulator with XRE-family HTH domain
MRAKQIAPSWTWGARLTELRLAKGVSLQVVADAAGVSKAHIWWLEKGRAENPTMTLLKALADFYGVSVSYLVGEGEPTGVDPDFASLFRLVGRLNEVDRAILQDVVRSMLKRAGLPRARRD